MIGLIGAGNMARAMARGWGEPILCTDGGSGRAAQLVGEVGGEALRSAAEVAERAELVVLAHKPAQLQTVAQEVADHARVVVSVLGATPLAALQSAYPRSTVIRTMPNTPVEVRRGVICMTSPPGADEGVVAAVEERLSRLGRVLSMPESHMEAATAVIGVAPAYVALIVEAQVDAGVKHGLAAAQAAEMFVETLAGTAELLAARSYDTLAVRREVTSPGGSTARGLAALEAGGLRAAFTDAMAAVVGQRPR